MWVDEGVVKTDSQSPRVVDGKIIKFVGYLVSLSLFNVLLFEGGGGTTLTLVSPLPFEYRCLSSRIGLFLHLQLHFPVLR